MEKSPKENLAEKQKLAKKYAMIYCALGFFLVSFSAVKIFVQNETNILSYTYLGAGIVFLAVFFNYWKKNRELTKELKGFDK